MKCLAIADLFINAAMMDAGLNALKDKGIAVEVRGLNRKEQKPWPYRKRCFRERMILTS